MNSNIQDAIAHYQDSRVQLTGEWYEDKQGLLQFCHDGDKLLAQLPLKSERDQKQQSQASDVLDEMRLLRQAFCQLHIQALAQKLFEAQKDYCTMGALALAAAELVPGLLPTQQQLDDEAGQRQADKEGCEVSQGIFFAALFADGEFGSELIERMRWPTHQGVELLAKFEQQKHIDFGKISLELKDRAGYITFNNPDCLNAEDNELIAQFEVAVDLVSLSEQVDVGVLRGGVVTHPRYKNKRVFSAGINLKHINEGKISFCDFILGREIGYINKMICGVEHLGCHYEKPWVAAVDTFAIGGGMQLLFACDFVLGAQDSYASLPAAKEGIVPGVSNLRLPQAANGRLATQVILHGRKIYAAEPDASVVFDKVVAPENMDMALLEAVDLMKAPAVIANRRMLRFGSHDAEAFRRYMSAFALAQVERLYAFDVLNKVSKFSGKGSIK